jgi:hypothetical protein
VCGVVLAMGWLAPAVWREGECVAHVVLASGVEWLVVKLYSVRTRLVCVFTHSLSKRSQLLGQRRDATHHTAEAEQRRVQLESAVL